jgi:DNA-directed RNA polymerase subunit RPC12/RpoP
MTDSDEAYVLVVCSVCGARLHPRRELIGKRVRCPDCGVPVRVVEPKAQAAHAAREPATMGEYKLSETDQPIEQPQTVLATCGTCSARLHPRIELVGKRVRCPDCGRPVLVPPPPKAYPVKAARPVGQYHVGSAPEPNPAPFASGVHLPDQPLHQPHALPPAAPRYWFLSGVFTFPWHSATISRWGTLTIFALFSNGATAFGLAAVKEMAEGAGGLGAFGVAMKVAGSIAAGAILWLITMAYASACVLAVVRDTASGIDEVTDWSGAENISDGIWQILDVVFPLVAAAGLGYGAYLAALEGLAGQVEEPEQWARLAGHATGLVTFPIMLVSALESGAFWVLISWGALRLIFGFWWGWILVNLEAGLLTAGWLALTALGMPHSALATVVLGAPLFAAVILIDARLFGRFLYRANEVVSSKEPDDDVDQDEAESDEPRA